MFTEALEKHERTYKQFIEYVNSNNISAVSDSLYGLQSGLDKLVQRFLELKGFRFNVQYSSLYPGDEHVNLLVTLNGEFFDADVDVGTIKEKRLRSIYIDCIERLENGKED